MKLLTRLKNLFNRTPPIPTPAQQREIAKAQAAVAAGETVTLEQAARVRMLLLEVEADAVVEEP